MANGECHYFYNKQTSLRQIFLRSPSIPTLYTILIVSFIFLSAPCSAASLKMCRKVGDKLLIDEQGCDMVAVYVNKCSGYCTSLSFMNPLQQNKLMIDARCCRMMDVEMIDVEVKCGSEIRVVKVASAVECSCFDCA